MRYCGAGVKRGRWRREALLRWRRMCSPPFYDLPLRARIGQKPELKVSFPLSSLSRPFRPVPGRSLSGGNERSFRGISRSFLGIGGAFLGMDGAFRSGDRAFQSGDRACRSGHRAFRGEDRAFRSGHRALRSRKPVFPGVRRRFRPAVRRRHRCGCARRLSGDGCAGAGAYSDACPRGAARVSSAGRGPRDPE